MSSLLQSPFMEDGIHEVVPDVGKLGSKLAASSVIAARRRVRIVPQSGQTYTVGGSGAANTINILIQDGQSYADLLSAALNFEVEVWDSANASGTTMALDDGAFCVFRRALVSLNSTLMDDIDLLPKKVLQETYATVDQSWYDTVGSWMGLYKANTAAYGVGAYSASAYQFIPKYDVAMKLALASNRQQIAQTGTGVPTVPGQNKFTVPVAMLSSFFRNETLFPLRNAGQLYLQLNLASALEACVSTRSSGTINPNYRIKNLTLDMDFVDMHPMYLSMMDSIMERPEEDGVRWPFDAHLVSAQNISGAGQQSVILSKASQNMRQIAVAIQPQDGLSAVDYPQNSTFANPGFKDIQVRCGSLYFPAFTSVGEHRAYSDLASAYGSPASLDKSGLVDVRNYYKGTPYAAGSLNAAGTNNYSDMWLWSYCFDRLKHAKLAGLDLDGINTLSTSGSQIVVQLNAELITGTEASVASQPPAAGKGIGNAILTGVLRFTRIVEIKGGATRVIG